MAQSAETRFLHVTNGTCTTRIMAASGIPGARSIWADPLYDGPVPGGLSDAELVGVRSRYLAGQLDRPTSTTWTGSDPALDPVNDLRQWRAVIEHHDSYDELILWFEHDLFDQLNLIQLLSWIHEHLPAHRAVSLVCIGSFPGRPGFRGLGELAPGELASLLETRRRVDDSQYVLAESAWHAFREPTPEALDALRRADTTALPFLGASVTRFLQEYPWTTDGLSRTERRFLELAADGRINLSAAFPRMHVADDVYYITDSSVVELAEELSRTSPPLLSLAVDEASGDEVLRGAVALTDAGRAVLAAEHDRVATCGIDRWLGGVHLYGDKPIWRWDDIGKRITRPSTSRPLR